MQRIRCFTAIAVAALVLAGCETDTALDDVGTLWGEDSAAEIEAAQARRAAIENKVPVTSVRLVEVGQTRDGFLISAFGTAPGLGYALPALRARRSGEPSIDGFIEFDFVASPPSADLQLPPGTTRTRSVRADVAVRNRDVRGVLGIRVFALQGGRQVIFAGASQPDQAQAQASGSPQAQQ